MNRVISTTLLACVTGGVVGGLMAFVSEANLGAFLYTVILLFGSTFFPVLIGVSIYQLVKRKWPIGNSPKKFILHILALISIFAIGILLWTVLDMVIYYSGFEGVTPVNLIHDFKTQFLGFTLVGLSIAIAIPSIDILLTKKSVQTESP